tara:strand:+ start:107 stop:808 length:702 start_codon:yes stop_codon:yes gene_type:complete
MTNKIESFNKELSDLDAAITWLEKKASDQSAEDAATKEQRQADFMSTEAREKMLTIGNEYQRLWSVANDGLDYKNHVLLRKQNPNADKGKLVTKKIIKEHAKNDRMFSGHLKQRVSEFAMYAAFTEEFDAASNEIVDEGKKHVLGNQQIISHMKKENQFPYPLVEPIVRDAKWLLEQVQKIAEKESISMKSFCAEMFTVPDMNNAITSFVDKKVQSMGKTKVTEPKAKKAKVA